MAKAESGREIQLRFIGDVAQSILRAFHDGKRARYKWHGHELDLPKTDAYVSFELVCNALHAKHTDVATTTMVNVNTYDGQVLSLPFLRGELLVIGHVAQSEGRSKELTDCQLPIVLHVHTGSRERHRSWMAQAWGYYQDLHEHNSKFEGYLSRLPLDPGSKLINLGLVSRIAGDYYADTMLHSIVVRMYEPCMRDAGKRSETGYTNDDRYKGANGHLDAAFILANWDASKFRTYLKERAKWLLHRYLREVKRGFWR